MYVKQKRERPFFRDLFITVCLCIPFVVIVFAKVVISLGRKFNAYFQSEWEKFNDIYGDRLGAEHHTDPALIAHIKGEVPVHGAHCQQTTSENVQRHRFRTKPQQTNKTAHKRSKLFLFILRAVNAVVDSLIFVPQKFYSYGQCVWRDFSDIHGDGKAELPYTDPAFVAYLKGEEGAPFIDNPHQTFTTSGFRNVKNVSEERNFEQQSGVGKEQCSASPTVGKRAETQDKLSNTEKALIEVMLQSSLPSKADSATKTLVHKSTTAKKPKKKVPQRIISPAHADVSASTPSNTGLDTGPKLFSSSQHSGAGKQQKNAPPAVGKQAETQVKLPTKVKAHRRMSQSSLACKADSAGRSPVLKRMADTKARERVTPPSPVVTSPTSVDAHVPTSPTEGQANGTVMPLLIQPAHKHLPHFVKAHDQEENAPIAAHLKQVRFANDCSDSEVFGSNTVTKPSAKDHIDVESTFSRGKRAKNEEESEEESWHVQTPVRKTQNLLSSELRNTKRKAEESTSTSFKATPTGHGFVAREIHAIHVKKLENGATAQPELMEVEESPPETPLPEPMETGGEQYAVIFGELGETNQASVSGSFVQEVEPMEIDQEPSRETEPEPMETNQGSVFDEFVCAWENIMQSFLYQPVEEMETDIDSVPATPCVAQLEAIMETMQEPVVISMPIGGQIENFQWPLDTGMETSEATFTVPQEGTIETNHELADASRPVGSACVDLTVGKRSLASALDVLKGLEETMSVKTSAAEQPAIQPVMKPATKPPPLTKRAMPPPLKKLTTQPLLVNTEMQPVGTDQPKSAKQLTMEQLQLIPKHHVGSESDSSDTESDDECEIDLEALDKYLEILIEKELGFESFE